MLVSYRLSTVTITLSLTIRPQFAIECLRRSNQQGWVTSHQNLGRKGLTDVSQILAGSGIDMWLPYTKNGSYHCCTSMHDVTDRQTTEL